MKKFSGPFDWVFSSLPMVRQCLEDDFLTLLDRSFYQAIPIDQRNDPDVGLCDHTLYRDHYAVGHMFNHFDPLSEDGYGYLRRCVDRFRNASKNGARNIAFALCDAEQESYDSVATLIDSVDKYCSLETLVVLVKPSTGSVAQHALRPIRTTSKHTVFEVVPASPLGPVGFSDPLDEYILRRLVESL